MSDIDREWQDFKRRHNLGNVIFQLGEADRLRARVAELERDKAAKRIKTDEMAKYANNLKDRVAELEADRRVLQQDGRHPSPCARHCEAAAFEAEIRRRDQRIVELESENERLRTDAITAIEWLVSNYRSTLAQRPVRDIDECFHYASAAIERMGLNSEGEDD